MKKLLVVLLLLFNSSVFAEGLSISIDKVRIEQKIKPGQVIEGTITASLPRATKKIKTKVECYDFEYNDQTEQIRYLPRGTMSNGCSNWITVSPSVFEINPGEKVSVHYQITVPSALDKPEYYAMIFFTDASDNKPKQNMGGVQFEVVTRIGVVVKLTVDGIGKVEGKITNFEVVKNGDHYDILYTIKNTGNTMVSVEGGFNVLDNNGVLCGRQTLVRKILNPGSEKTFKHLWYGELEKGVYTAILNIYLNNDTGNPLLGETTFEVK